GAWSIWAFAAPWIVLNSARLRVIQLVLLGIGMFLLQWIVLGLLYVGLQPFRPITTYTFSSALSSSWPTIIMVSALAFGVLLIAGRSFADSERARQLELRKSQLEAELTRAQLVALRLEIQPHFLFNTLNSIAALIRTRENDAALSMLVGLSDLMRSTLDRP